MALGEYFILLTVSELVDVLYRNVWKNEKVNELVDEFHRNVWKYGRYLLYLKENFNQIKYRRYSAKRDNYGYY